MSASDDRSDPERQDLILQGRRILIVEDEPFIAFDLADAIECAGGCVVGPAMSVREALRLVAEREVEAAILDVNLPDGDIGPVLATLDHDHVPLVIHSGAGPTSELRRRFPTLNVFTKPIAPATLACVLASALRARG